MNLSGAFEAGLHALTKMNTMMSTPSIVPRTIDKVISWYSSSFWAA